jgi:hypothetical protein
MINLLNQTENFILKSNKENLLDSQEMKWLQAQRKFAYNKYKRMIFLNPLTWERNSLTHPWADYIPVDQSLGGLKSDYLLSVLIHEMNVNSDGYLATDTHNPQEDNFALWECLKNKGIAEIGSDPTSKQRAFGLNAQLSVVYLKMILGQLK